MGIKELTKQDGKGVKVADIDDIRQHQLATEAKHPPSRSQVEVECWPPTREIPSHQLSDEDKTDGLRHDCPIGKTFDSQSYANDSRQKHGRQRADARLHDLQMSEEIGTLNGSET